MTVHEYTVHEAWVYLDRACIHKQRMASQKIGCRRHHHHRRRRRYTVVVTISITITTTIISIMLVCGIHAQAFYRVYMLV